MSKNIMPSTQHGEVKDKLEGTSGQPLSGSQIRGKDPSYQDSKSNTLRNTFPYHRPGSVGDERSKRIKSDGRVRKVHSEETSQLMRWTYEMDRAKLTLAEKLEKSKWDVGNCDEQ